MTLDEWLCRELAPPPALAARLTGIVRPHAANSPAARSDALLGCAETLLAELFPRGCVDRRDAVDLLVADALVTYAFEAAADEPQMLETQATTAMARLAAFAGGA